MDYLDAIVLQNTLEETLEETDETELVRQYDEDENYVEPLPENLRCTRPICEGALCKAQMLECCSKVYCRSCLNKNGRRCPWKCQKPYKTISYGEADRRIRDLKEKSTVLPRNTGTHVNGTENYVK